MSKKLSFSSPFERFQRLAKAIVAVPRAELRQLKILGEASKKISTELRAAHPEIPWRKVAGFRDVVVHDYFGVDLKEVWRIIQDDLPTLVKLLQPLVPPEEGKT